MTTTAVSCCCKIEETKLDEGNGLTFLDTRENSIVFFASATTVASSFVRMVLQHHLFVWQQQQRETIINLFKNSQDE